MSAAENKKRDSGTKSNTGGYIGLVFLLILLGGLNLAYGVYQGQQNQIRLTKAGNLREYFLNRLQKMRPKPQKVTRQLLIC